jgi:hypothetical protein
LVAAAPLASIWPGPSPLVDIPNWDNDIYLTGGGADASLGSRFTKSEPYAWRVVFLLMLQDDRAYGTEISPRSFVISFVILLYAISYNICI